MRTQIILIITASIFMFFGCNEKPKLKVIEKNNITTLIKNKVTEPAEIINYKAIEIEQLKQLIPIDTVDSKSKNTFEKYGLEFSGNCYDCDLAELSITKKSIRLTNVCDQKTNKVLEIVEIKNIDNGVEVKTKTLNIVFNEIDKAPVYELKIIGNNTNFKNLRISKYYTLKKLLKKFKEHDCGDFEG